jgi:ribose transport system substrate-binding protein
VLIPRPSTPSRAGRDADLSGPSAGRPAGLSRAIGLAAVAVLAVSACVPAGSVASPTPTLAPTTMPSPNPYTGATQGSGSGLKLGYVSYGELVPYVAQISAGIREQATLAGAELVECDAKVDGSQVAGCMDTLARDGVKGILQFQGDLADPAVVCAKVASGVPVVAIEFAQDPCATVLVSADDLRAGQIAGRAVGEWVKTNWSCTYDAYVSFESTVAAERSQRRMEGYRQGFAESCPVANEQVGRAIDTRTAARTAMEGLLTALAGKSRILVVAVNDDAALGALDAATNAGREGDVWVSGQGAEEKVRDAIRTNDHYLGDAAYFPERFGATAVPALLDLIAGKAVPARLLIEPAWVDASNIGQVYPQ